MYKRYRIVQTQNLNGDLVYVPQERRLLFFWVPFMQMDIFPKKIEFESFRNAEKFLKKQLRKPKDNIIYMDDDL